MVICAELKNTYTNGKNISDGEGDGQMEKYLIGMGEYGRHAEAGEDEEACQEVSSVFPVPAAEEEAARKRRKYRTKRGEKREETERDRGT